MIDITSKYLSCFKELEAALKRIASPVSDSVSFREILKKAKEKNPIIQYKEDIIWDLYALRNVFVHSDRDKYIANVNEIALQNIEDILQLIKNPPKVGNIFKREVYTISTNNITEIVLKEMQKNLYTHIPVYENDTFIGVLTETTILDWLVENIQEGRAQFYKQLIGKINRKYLNSSNNLHKFVSSKISIFDVLKIFEETIEQKKRLGAIFITKNGRKNEKIIGIITAWDLPKIKECLK